jgi:hypothetical protein
VESILFVRGTGVFKRTLLPLVNIGSNSVFPFLHACLNSEFYFVVESIFLCFCRMTRPITRTLFGKMAEMKMLQNGEWRLEEIMQWMICGKANLNSKIDSHEMNFICILCDANVVYGNVYLYSYRA